jgi:hypothetical protein
MRPSSGVPLKSGFEPRGSLSCALFLSVAICNYEGQLHIDGQKLNKPLFTNTIFRNGHLKYFILVMFWGFWNGLIQFTLLQMDEFNSKVEASPGTDSVEVRGST